MSDGNTQTSERRPAQAPRGALRATRTVMEQLSALTGRPPDGVSKLERSGDGWLLQIEIVELERIPATTSVLASYEVHADGDGNITSYARTQRYYRNRAEGA